MAIVFVTLAPSGFRDKWRYHNIYFRFFTAGL